MKICLQSKLKGIYFVVIVFQRVIRELVQNELMRCNVVIFINVAFKL